MSFIKTMIKKWLGSTGLFDYCRHCGGDLWFDEEKYALGHNVRSVCLKCTNLDRFTA